MNQFITKFLLNKWIQHLAFWVLSIYVIGSYFSISSILKFLDFIYSIFFHFCLFPLVYINLRYLIPRFFEAGKYFVYTLLTIFNIGLAFFIHDLIFDVIIPNLDSGFYIVSFTDEILLAQIFLIYIIITTLIKLSESWFKLQNLKKEKVSLELNALKSQLNPHFLFNGLNSIYSLAMNNDRNAAYAVLKLSNLLRFVLYEVENKVIDINSELDMIRNYADLQSLRIGKKHSISIETHGTYKPKIAPMLLLPIVENAFKHGNPEEENGFVRIETVLKEKHLHFECQNSIGDKDNPEVNNDGGIGLGNINRRLQLLYPESHLLKVLEKDNTFTVTLTIDLP